MDKNKIINKIKCHLFFMEISDNEILKILDKYNLNNELEEKLIEKILKHYYKLIKEDIYNNNNFSYINNYLSKRLSYDIKCINNLSNLFQKLEIEMNFELYEKIINQNTLLQEILKKILKRFDYNQKEINKLSNSNYTSELLKTYVIINNIELVDEIDNINLNNEKMDLNNKFLQQIYEIPLLSLEEEQNLTKKFYETHDIEIRNKIFKSNLRYVVKIAKQFYSERLSLYDLIQEGSIGLMTAIDRYDPNKGYKLSTYSRWWIEREIRNSVFRNYGIMRLTNKKIELLSKYKKQRESLNSDNLEEIATILNIPLKNVIEYEYLINNIGMGISINDYVVNKDIELVSLIVDNNVNIEETVINNLELKKLKDLILNLDDKEKEIMILRYGLSGNKPMTLKAIGKIYGNTKEGIRKIEKRTLEKLKRELIDNNKKLLKK